MQKCNFPLCNQSKVYTCSCGKDLCKSHITYHYSIDTKSLLSLCLTCYAEVLNSEANFDIVEVDLLEIIDRTTN